MQAKEQDSRDPGIPATTLPTSDPHPSRLLPFSTSSPRDAGAGRVPRRGASNGRVPSFRASPLSPFAVLEPPFRSITLHLRCTRLR